MESQDIVTEILRHLPKRSRFDLRTVSRAFHNAYKQFQKLYPFKVLPEQEEVIELLLASKTKINVLKLPVGWGKTVCAAGYLLRYKKFPVLWISNNITLSEQSYKELTPMLKGLKTLLYTSKIPATKKIDDYDVIFVHVILTKRDVFKRRFPVQVWDESEHGYDQDCDHRLYLNANYKRYVDIDTTVIEQVSSSVADMPEQLYRPEVTVKYHIFEVNMAEHVNFQRYHELCDIYKIRNKKKIQEVLDDFTNYIHLFVHSKNLWDNKICSGGHFAYDTQHSSWHALFLSIVKDYNEELIHNMANHVIPFINSGARILDNIGVSELIPECKSLSLDVKSSQRHAELEKFNNDSSYTFLRLGSNHIRGLNIPGADTVVVKPGSNVTQLLGRVRRRGREDGDIHVITYMQGHTDKMVKKVTGANGFLKNFPNTVTLFYGLDGRVLQYDW